MRLKQLFLLSMALLGTLTASRAADVTFTPALEVNFRTASGNTSWQVVKNAADEGNTDFELTYTAGFFALQKYTVPELKNATRLVLTLTVGSKSGVDAVRLWTFGTNSWTADSDVDDIVPLVAAQTGIEPRATEGTANEPLVKGAKVSNSDPAKATFTISGTALATIKANADDDGTFTLLLTNDNLTNTSNKRSYLSSNTSTDEANRPSLVATIETPEAPVVQNVTTGDEYTSLDAAFSALTGDAELVINDDVKLSNRCTVGAYAVTLTASKDVTITGPKDKMWFLVNKSNGVLRIGSSEHKITLDGRSDDRSNSSNVDVTRREENTSLYLTNIEYKNFTCGANHLVGTKNSGGAVYMEDITFNNCSTTDALVSNLREANDAVYLKGFLNVEDCTGTTIYTAKNRIRLGDPDSNTIYSDFSASNVITIGWGGSFAEGTNVVVKVPASAVEMFQLLSDEWTLGYKTSSGDLYMTKPVEPTVKIGDTGYADLTTALAAAQDGDIVTLLADQEVASRINVKNISITIDGQSQFALKRAAGYANGMLFLTQTADEGYTTALTLQDLTIDGQSIEATAAVMEASNYGTTTLNGVTFLNCVNTNNPDSHQGVIVNNKSGGKLVLNGVTFSDCTVAEAQALIFVGTNNVTIDGTNTIGSIYLSGKNVLKTADNAAVTTPIALTVEQTGQPVLNGNAALFSAQNARLSQQVDAVYAMPMAVAGTFTHPGLLHTAADIERVKDNLDNEIFRAAYTELSNASNGTVAGADEILKRMDKSNWEETYSDYNNFSHAATDARLAYYFALRYQLKGSTAAANAAVSILNDWAQHCKGVLRVAGKNYTNNIPDPNEYLLTIQAYQFANAAELLRDYSGWLAEDFQQFQTWIRQTFADLAYQFLENHHNQALTHYWLNWDLAALTALYSVGVLCDDQTLVSYALNYINNGQGMGSAANAVTATHSDPDSGETLAQCQESGRDQGHSTLDVTLMGALCQMAQNQGKDLFTTYKALEMAEYVGKYNLKDNSGEFVYSESDVPFTAYDNGEYSHEAISADGRGTERPCWELFHAYAKQNDKADAYAKAWVQYLREKNAYGEGAPSSTDELGFGTLMFAQADDIVPTGISELNRQHNDGTMATYSISGQRVQRMGKGLYIQNGKKLIVK